LASLIYTGTASQTTAYAATDIYTLAVTPGSITNVSQQGSNVVISTGATALTITGVTLAQLATANFAVQGGGAVTFGDGTSDTLADAFGNTLTGTASADVFLGLGGNDIIRAGNGANLVYGGSAVTDPNDGNDTIGAGTGNDTIYGNGGDDLIVGTSGSDVIYGGIGSDTIGAGTLSIGGEGAAAVTSSVLAGQTTSVYGGGGFNDTVDGADLINYASNAGTLTIFGNAGGDTINILGGAAGNQTVYGGLGNDTIAVNTSGNSVIFGGATDSDNITLTQSATSSATVYGGTGVTDSTDLNDTIAVGGGTAVVYGNAGADTITLTGSVRSTVYGGVGNDTISVTLAGTDTANGALIYGGSADSDSITVVSAAGQNSTIFGGSGINDAADLADTIVGGDGNEVIYGNGGADRLVTGAGNDQLFGGAGADIFAVTGNGNKLVADFGAGGTADTILLGSAVTLGTPTATIGTSGFSIANGTTFGLQVNGTTTTATTIGVDANGDFTLGATEARIVVGTNTAATLTGTTGANDTIFGGAGNDTITSTTGSSAADVINAGAGNDVINVTQATFGVIDGGLGTDTVAFTGGSTSLNIGGLANVETVTVANDGVYSLNFGGVDGTISAGQTLVVNGSALTGSNTLTFSGDGETAGAFSVTGGAAGDTITGGAANDTIIGGAGVDSLAGGTGNDLFRFATNDSGITVTTSDEIVSFNFGTGAAGGSVDQIAFQGFNGAVTVVAAGATNTAAADAAAVNTVIAGIIAANPDNTAQLLTVNNVGGTANGTYLILDGGSSDAVIRLTGTPTGTLDASDFATF